MLNIILLILYVTTIILSFLMTRSALKEGMIVDEFGHIVLMLIMILIPVVNIFFGIYLLVDEIDYEKIAKKIFFIKDKE